MSIVKQSGTITSVTALSLTAKEVVITLTGAIECLPGSFVNVFMEIGGTIVRRAYSVVGADTKQKTITLSVRHTLNGTMTPQFWRNDIIGRPIEVMGPLGKNTAEKLSHPTLHLFAYGIGAGVIKAITEYALKSPHVKKITITTGSRNEEDIIYKKYFDDVAHTNPHVSVRYVLSSPLSENYPYRGYVQDNLEGLLFTDADIYMCGQEAACNALIKNIEVRNHSNSTLFVEAFH